MEIHIQNIAVILMLAGSLEVLGQVSSICRPNERYLTCGSCQKTCQDPSPACAAICRVGCYCPDDQVRGKNGVCMPLSKCPSVVPYLSDTSEPISDQLKCSEDEEYRFCEPCGHRTCDNPNPMCPAQCARGCFCKGDMVRNRDGQCVDLRQCSGSEDLSLSNYVKRHTSTFCRGTNEEFKECQNCEKTCSNPNPICPAQCTSGCFCKDGYYKSPSGECVELKDCPKDTCDDKNAQYACRYPCEKYCSGKPCKIRAARCSLGCYCKPGYVKEDTTGKCVKSDQCLSSKQLYE